MSEAPSSPPRLSPAAPVLAIVRLCALLAFILVCLPFQIVAAALRLPLQEKLPLFFHTVLMRIILGIRVIKHGTISRARPTLFLCNHSSYLDIPALGSLLPARFISKSEVADWPLFGLLARLQNTVFVTRRGKLALQQSREIETLFAGKKSIILFPEGTSTNGREPVKPFKSSLLEAVQGSAQGVVTVQPVSLACRGKYAELYPWYGDMTLVPHLWHILGTTGLSVELTFHEPFEANRFSDRKALAAHAHSVVTTAPTGIL